MYMIQVSDVQSNKASLEYGVLQGSVLGPLLFTMYVSPLVSLVQNYNIQCHMYAGDTQIYISINPKCTSDVTLAVSRIEKCLVDVKHWMKANKLKLNHSKTEVVPIYTWQQFQKRLVGSINVGDECIYISGQSKKFYFILSRQWIHIVIQFANLLRLYKPVSDWLEMLPLDSTGLNM